MYSSLLMISWPFSNNHAKIEFIECFCLIRGTIQYCTVIDQIVSMNNHGNDDGKYLAMFNQSRFLCAKCKIEVWKR